MAFSGDLQKIYYKIKFLDNEYNNSDFSLLTIQNEILYRKINESFFSSTTTSSSNNNNNKNIMYVAKSIIVLKYKNK